MKLAICLLTADRPIYTADTLTSLLEQEQGDHILLHGDDGSAGNANMMLANGAGFETVYRSNVRRGPMTALRALWGEAELMGATHILHLENDIEFVAPIPIREDAQCVRLYGARKARSGPRQMAGEHIMGTKVRVLWTPAGEGWERGSTHWGGQPSYTRTELLLPVIRRAETFKEISMALQRIDTLRPRENVCWHMGDERTPEAKFNA